METHGISSKDPSVPTQTSKVRKIEQYFTFPVETVECFDLGDAEDLENFIKAHKKLLEWWLNGPIGIVVNNIPTKSSPTVSQTAAVSPS